jgi:hypothetical protein
VMPCALKFKCSRTLEQPCFLTVEVEGIMALWYARNPSTNNLVSHPSQPEPSALSLWKPQIFCDYEECCLLGCDSMYSGIWALYIILRDSKHFTLVLLVPVHQTMFCISECGSFQNNGWSLCSQLLYL